MASTVKLTGCLQAQGSDKIAGKSSGRVDAVTQEHQVKFGLANAILWGMTDQGDYQIIVICSKCNASGVAVLWDTQRGWSESTHESGSHLRIIPDGFSAVKTRIGFKFTCTDCGVSAEAKDYGS